jgi:hypothetical protein
MSSICVPDRPGLTNWLQSQLKRTVYLPRASAPVGSYENGGVVSYGS